MKEIIQRHLKRDRAQRVWSTTLRSGVEIACWRAKGWHNDKLVTAWPNGNWELFEMVLRRQLECEDVRQGNCTYCGHPMMVPTDLWCRKCEGPK